MRRLLLPAVVVAGGCSPDGDPDSRSNAEASPTALSVVQAQVAAFNRRDVAAMSAHVAHDVILMTVAGDSVVADARGRDAFERQMGSYFASLEAVDSEIEEAMEVGPFVAVRERAAWTTDGRQSTARSLGVYEVRGDSIRRVWYFPAVD